MARAKKKKDDIPEEIAAEQDSLEVSAEAVEEIFAVGMEETAVLDVSASETAIPEITADDVRLVEAILFASSSAVSVAQIAERFPEDRVSLIPQILDHIRSQYEGRGVNLVQRDSRWALRTASDLGDQLRLEKEQPRKFTRAAMETMAIIAYHQPVTRAEIENIRGVATSPGALDALMEAGWIKPGKRREVPGRPVTWLSTQAFLDHFGLEKLEDLPGMDELKAAGLLDKRPAIEAMPTADLFGDDENKQEEDPNEVTDEDLLGDPGAEEESYVQAEPVSGGDGDEDDDGDDDDDLEDEDSEDEAEDSSEFDEETGSDEEDGDDFGDEDSDEDGEDEDDEDEDDEEDDE